MKKGKTLLGDEEEGDEEGGDDTVEEVKKSTRECFLFSGYSDIVRK